MKEIFTDAEVLPAAANYGTTKLVNYFAEGAVSRLSNGLYNRLEAGSGPRYLKHGISPHCRCMGCYSWQIIEINPDGTKMVADETEDLMDWLDE